jgi:phage-related protein
MGNQKVVYLDYHVQKQIKKFPEKVQREFSVITAKLERDGKLKFPISRKVRNGIFELRIKHKGEWRALYGFVKNIVIILKVFRKKSQKTPRRFIQVAVNRLKIYL